MSNYNQINSNDLNSKVVHPKKKILLQVTGSIAAFKAVALCSKLVQAHFDVEVVMSEGAEKFVGAASFEGLTRKPVRRGVYDEGQMMAHIDLERWADLLLIYPASANTISSLATGRSDTLIGSIFIAHEFKKPYWIVPAMNQAMIAHPATRTHLQTLGSWGVEVLESDEGSLACGETGQGRLIEPEVILAKIKSAVSPPSSIENRARVLITAGGTTEMIDDVRSIINFSTGETGYTLAQALAVEGYRVTLVQSRLSHFQLDRELGSEPNTRSVQYTTTAEFTDVVKNELQNHHYEVVLHAAAVADYRVEKTAGKIQGDQPVSLKLIPNEKVLKSIRLWSKNPALKVVSFKLTSGEGNLAGQMKLDSYDSEFIIHNEKKNVNGPKHSGTVFEKNSTPTHQTERYRAREIFTSKNELASIFSKIMAELTLSHSKKEVL